MCTFFILILMFSQTEDVSLLSALRIYTFPVFFFFQFLFYTESISIFFFCLSFFLLFQKKQFFLSGIFCALSVFCRQTIIVWAFWMGICIVYDTFLEHQEAVLEKSQKSIRKFSGKTSVLDFSFFSKTFKQSFSFLLLGFGFAFFLVKNGGKLVIGDHEHHEATSGGRELPHVTQFFYFLTFFFVFSPSEIVQSLLVASQQKKTGFWNSWKCHLVGLATTGYLCYKTTAIHIFMLSDNRHYIFYIWRKVFKINLGIEHTRSIALKLSPLFWWVFRRFVNKIMFPNVGDGVSVAIFMFCLVCRMSASKLVEFRYYIIPFFIVFMLETVNRKKWKIFGKENSTKKGDKSLENMFNVCFNVVVNVVTIYVFLLKPFGPKKESRFMW